MIRAILLSLLGGVSRDYYNSSRLWWCLQLDTARVDLARVEAERDAAHAEAGEWCTNYHDAHQRIADLEAKLASAERKGSSEQ